MNKIVLNNIEISNFLSIGSPIIFDFKKHYGLQYIYGLNRDIEGVKNGIGKTTIFLDSILFALFGLTSKDIPNKFIPNRQMPHKQPVIVNLSFNVNDDEYLIESGYTMPGAHGFVNLYKNRTNITKASVKETRAYIENEILHGSFEIFKNSMFLSACDSRKFFEMKKADKRAFIEEIFNLQVFGQMLLNIRTDINNIDKTILSEQNIQKQLKINLEDYTRKDNVFEKEKENTIKEIKAKILKKQNFIKELNVKIENELNIQKNIKIDDLDNLEEDLKKLQTGKGKIEALISITKNNITNSTNLIDKYKDILKETCSECKSKLVDKLNIIPAQESIDSGTLKIKDCNDNIKIINEKIKELSSKIYSIKSNKKNLQQSEKNVSEHKMMIVHQEDDIKELIENEKKENVKSTPFKELINKTTNTINDNEIKLQEYYIKKKYLDILELAVSEEGAKKYIIKDLILVLNGRIKKYLDQMGALYTCLFDETLNCDFITETGVCTYENFSNGEKVRINTAVIFAFRDILMSLGTISSSILVLDEFFDIGLDNYAINAIIKNMKELNEKNNQTVYIISHRECIAEEDFTNIIRIEKQGGFTQISSDPQGEM